MIGVPTGAWIAVGKLAGAEAAIWSGIVSILCILFVFMAIEGWKAWKEVATRGDLLRTEVRIREKFLSQDEMARVQIGVAFRGPGTAKSCTARVYELAYCFHDRDDSGAVVSKWADLTRKDVVGPQPLVWAQSEGCADSSGFILDIPSDGDIRLLDVLKMYKNGHSLVATTRNPSETPIGRSQAGDNSIIKIGIRVTSQDTPAITKRVVLCVRKIDPPMVGALGITANLWSERDEAEYLERRRNAEPLWEGPI
ncbi:MAG: hypothetical protein KDA16_09610 [Phycisphaerales bacterium]|nr:hypothetical protein [Phycisphaerales bacterium]